MESPSEIDPPVTSLQYLNLNENLVKHNEPANRDPSFCEDSKIINFYDEYKTNDDYNEGEKENSSNAQNSQSDNDDEISFNQDSNENEILVENKEIEMDSDILLKNQISIENKNFVSEDSFMKISNADDILLIEETPFENINETNDKKVKKYF